MGDSDGRRRSVSISESSSSSLAHRVRDGIKVRGFYAYCNALKYFKTLRLPEIRWRPLYAAQPKFVSIVRSDDVPLLIYSLKTLMEFAERRPPLLLIGDSDQALKSLRDALHGVPPEVEVCHWESLLAKLNSGYREFIAAWVASGKWGGYAKKFAVTLAANGEADIVVFDADVLWFGDFAFRLATLDPSRICAGQDYTYSYDKNVAHALGDSAIYAGAPLNCGLVYYPRATLGPILTDSKLTGMLRFAEKATPHLEQTLIAHAFWRTEGKWFPPDVVATTMADQFRLRRGVIALARHYAGAKHLFWRDAG